MMRSIFLLIGCVVLASCKKDQVAQNMETASMTASSAETEEPAMAFADAKYVEIGKRTMNALSKGSMDMWAQNYAEDVRYHWNAGDSLVGKPAVEKFWRERRGNIIESLTFSEQIWIPIQVNKPQATEQAGVWLLSWHKTTAKYKGGATMVQWMHTAYHFDSKDKINQVVQYIDRVPIAAALAKK